ncbi:hypothetical protein [Williamwhitmania taraxaci]|uniref:Uncharacterized protein n=1 Tax=Williamwhitmania taraxaci TaxID=1640674 RepID=A0A1G6U3Z3_9BACT|nr:hypothetical protein [Williamwhitmania taraxaci]SDD36058.1 hypothetical protein SAMN05216323_11522 [Williamwhitmania taraxaci]
MHLKKWHNFDRNAWHNLNRNGWHNFDRFIYILIQDENVEAIQDGLIPYSFHEDISDRVKTKQEKRIINSLNEIKIKNSNMYNRVTGLVSVSLEKSSFDKFRLGGANTITYGVADPDRTFRTDYELLSLANLTDELNNTFISPQPTTIIKDAILVRKFSSEEKNKIIKMITDGGDKEPELFANWCNRIKLISEERAKVLHDAFAKKSILLITNDFLNELYYEVKRDETTLYMTMGKHNVIYLNYDKMADNLIFLQKLAHEMRHVEYPMVNTYNSLKWLIIRKKSNQQRDYSLGDELNNNGACSCGASHEKNNPENTEVCAEENKYIEYVDHLGKNK